MEIYRLGSSVITFSTNDSYTQMSPPLLDRSEQEILDTSLETAHSEIFYLRARLTSARKLVKDLHEERRSHLQMISDLLWPTILWSQLLAHLLSKLRIP